MQLTGEMERERSNKSHKNLAQEKNVYILNAEEIMQAPIYLRVHKF